MQRPTWALAIPRLDIPIRRLPDHAKLILRRILGHKTPRVGLIILIQDKFIRLGFT